jgi:protein MpaA
MGGAGRLVRPGPRLVVSLLALALAAALVHGLTSAAGPPVGGRGHGLDRRVTIGRSVRGRAITARNVGAPTAATKVLVVGCIHGNECAGKAVVRALRRARAPRRYELWLLSDLNPDGSRANTRQNARGVDLNRNFAAGWRPIGQPWDAYHSGRRPWSEPETRAARAFILRRRPDITIWYHQSLALVTKRKRHVRVQRRYARLVDLPLTKLDALPGTAPRWQDHRFPGHTSFVVELRAGPLGRRAADLHARAVRRVAHMWRRVGAQRSRT